jgi:hypothetical protein
MTVDGEEVELGVKMEHDVEVQGEAKAGSTHRTPVTRATSLS